MALILLGGFLYQSADGLTATLCHLGASGTAGSEMAADHSTQGAAPAPSDHPGHQPSDRGASPEDPADSASQQHDHDGCPFGAGALAGCGVAISVAAPSAAVQAQLPVVRQSDPRGFSASSGILLAERPFQPPRT